MSRKTKLTRTIRREVERQLETTPPQQEENNPRGTFIPKIVRIGGVASAAIGLVAALLTFLPRLSVTISDPPDPDNAFSALVTVTNTGDIPLESVGVMMGVGIVCASRDNSCTAPEFPSSMDYKTWFKRTQMPIRAMMHIDDHFTIALDDIGGAERGTLKYADIAVVVTYKIPFVPIPREKVFPLYTRKASNGKLYWQWK